MTTGEGRQGMTITEQLAEALDELMKCATWADHTKGRAALARHEASKMPRPEPEEWR
jgi:hypothetical protein